MWSRTRMTLLIAWVLILGVVAYLATHPRLLAPPLSRLVTRNLFRDLHAELRMQDFRLQGLSAVEFYHVTLLLNSADEGVTLVTADTLGVEYRLGDLLARTPRLRQVRLADAEIYMALGHGSEGRATPPTLPHLEIQQILVGPATVEVSGPEGRLRERIVDASLRGVLHADGQVVLELRDADLRWETRQTRLRDVHGRIQLDGDGLRLEDVCGIVNESRFSVSGTRAGSGDLDLQLAAQGIRSDEIESLTGITLGFAATGREVSLGLQSHGDSLALDIAFDGILEGYHLEGGRGRAVLTPGRLQWSELTARVNGSAFDGTALFLLRGEGATSFVMEGQVADVDLAQGLIPDTEMPPTRGRGRLRIERDEARQGTRVAGVLYDGAIAKVDFDTCRFDVTADPAGVICDRLELRHRRQLAHLTGRTDSSGVFDGYLDLLVPDLAQLPASWNLPEVKGHGRAQLRLQGPVEQLDLAGRVVLHGAALGPLALSEATVRLRGREVLTHPSFQLEADGDGLQVGGVILGSFALGGDVAADAARLARFRSQRGDTVVTLQGEAAFGEGIAELTLTVLGIVLEGQEWRLGEPVTAVRSEVGVDLPSVNFVSAHGALGVRRLRWHRDQLQGTVSLHDFDLGLLNPFLEDGPVLSGSLTAEAQLSGQPDEPIVSLSAVARDVPLEAARIDSLSFALDYAEGALELLHCRLWSNQGDLLLSGTISHPGVSPAGFWPGAALNLQLQVNAGDWDLVDRLQLEALDRLAGSYEASLTLGGTTDRPLVTGQIVSEPFNVHWLHLERLAARVILDRDALVLADLEGHQGALAATGRIELPLRFDLLSPPTTPPEGPFLMQLSIPEGTDLAPLVAATNGFVEAGGHGSGEITLAGPLIHPLYQGWIRIRDGSCVLRGQGEIYREVAVDGTWSGDELTLTRLEGREGERGHFQGSGRVQFMGLTLRTFEITAAADRFLVASIPQLRVLVRTDRLRLTGVPVGPDSVLVPYFEGRLQVIEGRYTGDFSERPSVSDPRAATVAPDWLADIHLVAPPRSLRIVNRAMELYMSGDFDLVRDDLEGLYLRGSLTIDAGRLPVFNNDFRVVRGQLDFSHEVGLLPIVDIEAETNVRIHGPADSDSRLEKITVHVTGSLETPEVAFTSESGYGREGIERMLLGLSPYAGDPQEVGGLRLTSIAVGLNLLEREIASAWEVVDTFDIDQIERRNDSGGVSVVPLIGVGKYLGQDLYVKYARGVSDADQDLLVEYQLTNHLLVQYELRRRIDELQGDATHSVDLKYRIEY
jgi:hypothetical protein